MHTKIGIFVLMGISLVTAIYSTVSLVSAEPVTVCTGTSKTTSRCSTWENNEMTLQMDCTYHSTTKKWSCVETTTTKVGSDLPPGLQSAVDAARAASENTPKDSKNLGDLKNNSTPGASPDLG